jgi:allantoinase
MRARDLPLERAARWLSEAPARLLGLAETRGAIAPGRRADLGVWDPEASFVVDAAQLFHRHPTTPYHGRELYGVVDRTYLGGQCIYHDGEVIGEPGGRVIS